MATEFDEKNTEVTVPDAAKKANEHSPLTQRFSNFQRDWLTAQKFISTTSKIQAL